MGARALIEAHEVGLLKIGVSVVVFDRPSTMQQYCELHNVPYLLRTSDCFNQGFLQAKDAFELHWLGLTFNRLLSPEVLSRYQNRIFNLHMSLLPIYPGFGATRKALESGITSTGVTIHLVDEGMDTGPILAQRACPILSNDTITTLGRRQFEVAVPLLLQTVRNLSNSKLLPFNDVDEDLSRFAQLFCARLT